MSGVVLRCPNCGTTKATAGECEACHEAEVRFFCTSHTPGRWLEGRQCPDCGARFGEAAPPRPAPPRAPEAASVPSAAPAAPRRARTMPWRRTSPPDVAGGGLGRRDEREALRDVIRVRFPELLRTAASRGGRPPTDPIAGADDRPLSAAPGCLRAALLLAMFLLVAFLSVSMLIGGSLLQVFGFYF